MGKRTLCILLCAFVAMALWASGTDRLLTLGRPGAGMPEGWSAYLQSTKGINLVPGYKGRLDLSLAHASYTVAPDTDALLHFDSKAFRDETGHYEIKAGVDVDLADGSKALMGAGSLRTDGTAPLSLLPGRNALFAPGGDIRDFSIDFWLFPARLEEGETILRWNGTRTNGAATIPESISCVVEGSALLFSFDNFFLGAGKAANRVDLLSRRRLTPGAWSHHLVRFDSGSGLLEYVQDGQVEAVEYATSSGKEAGSIYLPMVGTRNALELCPSFSGMLDEFRISSSFIEKTSYDKYPPEGGRAESKIFDLGFRKSALRTIAAISSIPPRAAILYYYRASDVYGDWSRFGPEWKDFTPGSPLPAAASGRYLQIAVELYPDPVAQAAPRLSELDVSYAPDLPPAPPRSLLAKAADGRLELSWTKVPEADVEGYYLYYGPRSGEYLGEASSSGPSPIDVGNATAFTLRGLKNGVLYFVAVAAYDGAGNIGPFSPEQAVRPVRMVE